jgi:outer membrane protein, heavy metal efflux system
MTGTHRRDTLRLAVAGLLCLLAGCAVQDYAPALLPAFTREHIPAAPDFLQHPTPPPQPATLAPPVTEDAPAGKVSSPGPVEGELSPPRRVPTSLGAPVGEPVQLAAARVEAPQGTQGPGKTELPPNSRGEGGATDPGKTEPGQKGKEGKVEPGKGGGKMDELPSPRRLETSETGLTLDQAIEQTLKADPKLRATWEAVNLAKGDLLTSSLLPNPALLLDGQLMPLTRPFTVDRQGGPPQADMQVGWAIDWFLFGKRAAAMASARLGVEVSAADYADQVRQRVAGAIAAFYDLLEAQAQQQVARQDLEALKRVEAITARAVKAGGTAEVDLDRARLAVLDSQRELRRRETALATAAAVLRTFLGMPGVVEALQVRGSLAVPSPTPPPSLEETLLLAEQNRPDLISLRRQLDKAEADVRVERTKAWPTITPTWDVTRQFQTRAIGFPDATSWGIFLNMNVPLFDRNQGNIRKALSTREQISLNLRAQLVAAQGEIEQALAELKTAYANVTTSDPEQLRTARSVRDRILASYGPKAGGRTLLEVLDAERAYRDTLRLFITGESSYWHALWRLNAAIGKQVLR